MNVAQAYLSDLLHVVSQFLLIPTIIILLVLIGYALFCIGSIVAEYFTEHKRYEVSMPTFLASLMEAKQADIPEVIKNSGLLNRQKEALLTVYDFRALPGDALVALIRRLVSEQEAHYDHIVGRNNTAARVSPMIGLMGTLIPLGPGIEALGRADTSALSSSLLIAFDTTVAGLVVAAICLVISKIRTNWYNDYMSALDSGMATMLEKIEEMRAAGEIQVKEPDNYRFLYGAKENDSAGAGMFGKAKKAAPAAAAATESAAKAEQPAPEAAEAPEAVAAPEASASTEAPAVAETAEVAEAVETAEVAESADAQVQTPAVEELKKPATIDANALRNAVLDSVGAQQNDAASESSAE